MNFIKLNLQNNNKKNSQNFSLIDPSIVKETHPKKLLTGPCVVNSGYVGFTNGL